MAVRLGYGGLGNTNGARDFSGKAELLIVSSAPVVSYAPTWSRRWRGTNGLQWIQKLQPQFTRAVNCS